MSRERGRERERREKTKLEVVYEIDTEDNDCAEHYT